MRADSLRSVSRAAASRKFCPPCALAASPGDPSGPRRAIHLSRRRGAPETPQINTETARCNSASDAQSAKLAIFAACGGPPLRPFKNRDTASRYLEVGRMKNGS
jgi:hypothetical protein